MSNHEIRCKAWRLYRENVVGLLILALGLYDPAKYHPNTRSSVWDGIKDCLYWWLGCCCRR